MLQHLHMQAESCDKYSYSVSEGAARLEMAFSVSKASFLRSQSNFGPYTSATHRDFDTRLLDSICVCVLTLGLYQDHHRSPNLHRVVVVHLAPVDDASLTKALGKDDVTWIPAVVSVYAGDTDRQKRAQHVQETVNTQQIQSGQYAASQIEARLILKLVAFICSLVGLSGLPPPFPSRLNFLNQLSSCPSISTPQ